jgi:hypothetical protein
MDFGKALQHVKEGRAVCRRGWNGKDMFIALYGVGEEDVMTMPFIYMRTACFNLVPWLASQTDLLATDWQEYGDTV